MSLLPHDHLTLCTVSFLDIKDVCSVKEVCKKLNQLVSHSHSIWKGFLIRDFNFKGDVGKKVALKPNPFYAQYKEKSKKMDYYQWVEETIPFRLRKADITSLHPGDTMRILFFDRNVADIFTQTNEANTPYSPEHFFRENYQMEYSHKEGLTGSAIWQHGKKSPEDFEFQILVEEDRMWRPICKVGMTVELKNGGKKPVSEFSPQTFIGWRGYAMRWDDLQKLPQVQFHFIKF